MGGRLGHALARQAGDVLVIGDHDAADAAPDRVREHPGDVVEVERRQAVLTDAAPVAAGGGDAVVTTAAALRAVVDELPALSGAERALMVEWLDRAMSTNGGARPQGGVPASEARRGREGPRQSIVLALASCHGCTSHP